MRRYASGYNNYKPRSLRKQEQKSIRKFIYTVIFGIFILFFLITWGLPNLIGSLTIFRKATSPATQAVVVEDTAIAPPVLNIPYEATNTANIRVNGYSSPGTKVELYLDDELKNTTEVGDDGSFTTDEITLSLGTNNIYGKTLDQDKKSLPSKNIKVLFNNEKPTLDIISPSDNQQVKGGDKKVVVSGKTDPENNVTVNGSTVIVNNDGAFSTTVSLNDGDNTINITSTNMFGNSTKTERKVNYST
jgi:hypothetical protein